MGEDREEFFEGNQVQNEESYGVHLNGNTQGAPPWPQPQTENETMFLLPRKLQYEDNILISGQMTNQPQLLTVNLVTDSNGMPDYQNIACQVEVRFNEDKTYLKTIINGNVETINSDSPSELFGDSSFDFEFKITYRGPAVEIYKGDSYLGQVDLKHSIDYIRYLTVYGDVQKVNKLEFKFV
ncbi:uncharacterized protein LOC126369542 isoform X2 [Pectinophora gossypiella]|uniref:uncharacterized protein LOC126369542 isoform X2 n=1 Tax=Pectinophora gossypiella TaxID=13191 RepID=UPI00214F17A8|nr:uncharacterized protein LOC126369542 isoform X2 [Pectinophora gossypiella]